MTTTIPLIIDQHAEEAAFLWLLRSYAVAAPHYRLKDLAKLDNRVEAHLDGLRIAGDEGWLLCEQALATGEPGEVFAAALLALESKDPQRLAKVVAIAETAPEAHKGLISALGWIEPAKLSGTVMQWLVGDSAFLKQIGLAACAIHRVNPGKILDDILRDADALPALKARALRTAGEIKRRDLLDAVRDCLRSDDESIRFWAAWSAVLLGNRSDGLLVLQSLVTGGRFAKALPLLLRALPLDQAGNALRELAQNPARQRDLVAGAGMIGDPYYVPWLIKQMENPALARLAGESFSLISGADIAYEDLDGDRPQGFESGPSEESRDDNVALDSDENLPWPDPHKIQAWWNARQGQFQTGLRYLLGQPISEAQCRQVLRDGFQRQRAAAALELALLKPDEVLFEARAPGWRQQRLLHNPIHHVAA